MTDVTADTEETRACCMKAVEPNPRTDASFFVMSSSSSRPCFISSSTSRHNRSSTPSTSYTAHPDTATALQTTHKYSYSAPQHVSPHPLLLLHPHLQILPLPLLKPIDLAPAHIIIQIRQRRLPTPLQISPAPLVLCAVQVQRAGEHELDGVADGDRVEFCVDVEGELGVLGDARAGEAGDAVVFLGVEGGDGEGFLVELRIGHVSG